MAERPPNAPPDWFKQAQDDQAKRARRDREQAQQAALSRAQQTRRAPMTRQQPGRQHHGPVRQNETPWIGVPPGAMFPAAEDATMLIQRITDAAVPEDVQENAPASSAAGMKTASTAGVVRAGALMAIATVVSRVTGLLSKSAIVAILGGLSTGSSYTVANTLPNIVFELLIGGVLTSVAIPLLTRAQRSDPDGGQEYTQRLMTIALVGLLIATVIAVLAAPLLARLYLSDSKFADPELTTQLGRLLLPQIFFYGLAALFGAILNTKEKFAANAWAPVLNNIVVIGVAVVLYLDTRNGPDLTQGLPTRQLLILGVGTTLGIVLQAAVMIPSLLRSGFRFKFRWGWDKRLTEAGGLVGWAIVYVLISQVGVVVTTRVASGDSQSGPLVFSYASLLFQMPYGILGVAVLTAIMPRLSRHAAAGEMEDVKNDVSLANRLSAVALLPVSAALIVVGGSLSVILFAHGELSQDSALQIGLTIGGMAIGLVPLAMTLVQMRVFYAMKDGRTPTIINGIMVAVRVPLLLASVWLEPKWVVPGLAMATAVSYIVGAVVGEIWLRARFGPMGTSRTLRTIGKMVVASAVGGVAAFAAVHYTVGLRPTDLFDAVKILVIGAVVGGIVIAIMTLLLGVEELTPVRNRILRLVGRAPTGVAAAVTVTSPTGMGRSPGQVGTGPGKRPGTGPSRRTSPGSDREQVTERVTQAGAGGPRNPSGPVGTGGSSSGGSPDVAGDSTTTRGDRDPIAPPPPGGGGRSSTTSGGESTVNLGGTPASSGPLGVLAPGATVGGRYRLVTLVATDDAGNRFWRAKDTVLPRDMAVTLLPDNTATSATVARTLRVGRLHHIGLPQTLDVGTEQGQSYVVGQWVDGATLTDLLAGGPLEPDVATSITAKVSEAVAEAHRNGIALGAINPSLVRVNFDGQVRLSHVIAHGSATPDQDIRAVGGLLYLMLTGTWPLPAGAAAATVDLSGADRTTKLSGPGTGQLTPAPTRLGREVPAAEVRSGIPSALSALAERALHPDEPSGIHAVGAIAALLRQPEVGPAATVTPVDEPSRPSLNPAERRLVKERRVKLGIATVMIAVFSALIIIVVASLAKQVMSQVAGPSVTIQQKLATGPDTTAKPVAPARTTPKTTTAPTKSEASTSSSVSTSSTAPAAAVQKPVDATVYDPMGDGVKDNIDQVPQAFDGNPQTFWSTFVYKQQFPSLIKPGVGLNLEFTAPITPTSVTVSSDTPDTTIEVRASNGKDLPYVQTTVLAQGNIANASNAIPGSVTIALTNAPKSKYLVIFVVHMAADGSQYKSDINEITVSGS
ncbi:putative peptidoglycan lipid II flippase [Nakamurella sp. UYEF19]